MKKVIKVANIILNIILGIGAIALISSLIKKIKDDDIISKLRKEK